MVETRVVRRPIPYSEFSLMRQASGGFPEWYARTKPEREVTEVRVSQDGEWSDWVEVNNGN